ncbi:aftiphilin-like [Dunckerocampus dactyliophorus]|uniref:aftiphilin-like n=1 Tax=Dunckerocampus dactyliophorus TaxID=161453 RepID=UPI0024075054|nr:aftiphilin-like [Dunckerocampus dactyliophorus]XP_054654796.1 aftiphilin-like [Dunckerocampus dactyliophorus]XP_054654797.1 aftiphilin-like [Dunckerocampus dactyliophorus]XP_054654798.1 aftiphilin-like [Dunckerocampus dactyliophorus]
MEPDILPYQHSSAPPPLDDDMGEAGSEEDEFGGFVFDLAAPTEPPFPKSSFTLQTEHSIRESVEGGQPSLDLCTTNGYCSSAEETGFADFSVFTEQAAHPWCCGFAPLGGTAVGTKPSSSLREGRQVVMDAEPRSRCACTPHQTSQDKSHQTSKLQKEDVLNTSATEDLDSFCDDVSYEGPSEDLEPNVSSLASQGDQTGDEDESLSEWDMYCHRGDQAASQGTCATSNVSSQFNAERFDNCVDGETLGLPPSDSFADFCSAAPQEDGNRMWAEFKDTRSKLPEQVSSLQLLQASFPEEVVPPEEEDEDEEEEEEENVPSLGALLHPQEEEKTTVHRVQHGFWRPHQDIHGAAGLMFQWRASHANRTLLRCLGLDMRDTWVQMNPDKDCFSGHTPATTSGAQTHT